MDANVDAGQRAEELGNRRSQLGGAKPTKAEEESIVGAAADPVRAEQCEIEPAPSCRLADELAVGVTDQEMKARRVARPAPSAREQGLESRDELGALGCTDRPHSPQVGREMAFFQEQLVTSCESAGEKPLSWVIVGLRTTIWWRFHGAEIDRPLGPQIVSLSLGRAVRTAARLLSNDDWAACRS